MSDLTTLIEQARHKQIEVLVGERYSDAELDAVAAEFGVKFPADYRTLVIETGALSFRRGDVHYFVYGKPSAETIAAQIPLDIMEAGNAFKTAELLFAEGTATSKVVPVAARVDLDYGHVELTLVDADGAYRSHFEGDAISEPRLLLDVVGMFPFFLSLFREDGARRSPQELLDAIGGTVSARDRSE
jgi:hypothetical protein